MKKTKKTISVLFMTSYTELIKRKQRKEVTMRDIVVTDRRYDTQADKLNKAKKSEK